MFTRKKLLFAAGVILLFGLFFVTMILPGMIVDRAEQWVAAETGRDLAIESIAINPFGLTVTVHKLRLSDKDPDKPFVSWDLLQASLSFASLYHRAPVLDELRLERPVVHLERLAANRFNFSDLIPPEQAEEADDASEPTRFAVENLAINDGRVEFLDSSLAEPARHTITDLQLALPEVGNLPVMVENPARPYFSAVINDAPIVLEGALKPFSDVQEMRFDLVLQDFDLPFYLGYVPTALPVELRNGRANLDLDIIYRITPESGGELILSGEFDLISLDIRDKLREQLFFLPLLRAEIAESRPLEQELHLAALRIYNLEVWLERDARGNWNHARMAQAGASPDDPRAAAGESDEPATPLRLQIDTVEVRDGIVFFTDRQPAGGFETVAREINIDVEDFALAAQAGVPFALSLETDHDEQFKADGHFHLQPFSLALHTDLKALSLGAYAPYYQEIYRQPFAGTLDLAADILVNPEQPLLVSNGKLSARNLYAAFNNAEGVAVDRFDIDGLSFDLADNRLKIAALNSADARINFSRDKTGEWSFMSRNFPILAKRTDTSAEQAAPDSGSEGPAFGYRIDSLDISNWDVAIRDELPAEPVRIAIDDLSLTAGDLAAPEQSESPFRLAMTLQDKGNVILEGTASLAARQVAVDTHLQNIPLAFLAPYVAEQADLVLADGNLNARLSAEVAAADDVRADVTGDLGVNNLYLLDSLHREDLLKWGSLQIAGIEGGTEPLSLAIESITLSDYFAKILIDEEARLNLTEAFSKGRPEEAGDAAGEESEAASADQTGESPGESADRPEMRIETVILQGGRIDFTDRNLPQTFHADMRELGGRIQGLSSNPESRAEVDLRGSLRSRSPLTVSGRINPLAEELFLDLKLSFTDIELSPLSPYSGTYVGYLIEKGKLNLDLEYFIEDSQLKARNELFLDQFTFGEPVESDRATSLPVRLAVALLKDRNGEIHLDIPVSGDLDNPQFSVVSVIWTIVRNLLVKAATSPLALLGALVGGGEEDFSQVTFAYGSARLPPPEQEKLQHMAEALLARPALNIEVKGFADRENDPEAYRREWLRDQVKRAKYLALLEDGDLPEDATMETIEVTSEEYPDYLWEVYKEAPFPKPRNFIGMIKHLPDAELEKLIYANTEVGADELTELAQSRAEAVHRFLIDAGGLPGERVFLTAPEVLAEAAGPESSGSRVEFNVQLK